MRQPCPTYAQARWASPNPCASSSPSCPTSASRILAFVDEGRAGDAGGRARARRGRRRRALPGAVRARRATARSTGRQSPHEGAQQRRHRRLRGRDARSRDGAFDAVLFTQVLEHVPEPARVLAELHRILRPGGTLYLTAPLVWELHELPHDYYRYTSEGLAPPARRRRASRSVEVEAAQRLLHDARAADGERRAGAMGSAPDGLDERRAGRRRELLRELAEQLAAARRRSTPSASSRSGTRPSGVRT